MRHRNARLLALAILLIMPFVGLPEGAARPRVADEPAVELYVTNASDGHWLAPLDPATLADRTEATALFPGADDWAFSGDGSMLITLHGGDEPAIVIRDPATGAERARFAVPEGNCCAHVSHDGSRVLLLRWDMTRSLSGIQPGVWYVFDTVAGRHIATVEFDAADVSFFLLSPDGSRLYRLVGRSWVEPKPMRLFAYDLTSGVQVGELDLPEVLAGSHMPGRGTDEPRSYGFLQPGVAMSPDGTRIAIAHADRDAITLVDTATLQIDGTVALARPTTLVDRLVSLLPLVPRSTEAKMSEGAAVEAVFSTDGRQLYIYGREERVEGSEEIWAYGLGLKVIDVETGEIVAEGLHGELISRVLPTPDGDNLYVVGSVGDRQLVYAAAQPAGGVAAPILLRRLDAMTLDTLAEREFADQQWVVLRPVSNDAG